MTITRQDLKIAKPELLGASDDAGGQRTRNFVQSGKLNELFRAISDIDHAQSAIDIVKCYPALDTQDTSTLLDAHVFISEAPTDPLVSLMLVEADSLDDSDRMTDMKEIIESSVTAGSLFRSGGPGFLPNQNNFSQDYLTSVKTLNNREYRVYTQLRVGQVIAISVEYSGNEDTAYPRFVHYAKVVQLFAPGNSAGNVVFEPPMSRATPESHVNINGDNNCTKLRLVNEASPLKFHGVTKLTSATSSKTLAVEATKKNLLPVVLSEQTKSGISLAANGVLPKTVSQVASEAQSYQFDLTDVLQGENQNVDYSPKVSFKSGGEIFGTVDAVIVVATDKVSVTLARKPDINSNISLSYISSSHYQNYDNADAFPAAKQLVLGSLDGKVILNGGNYTFVERDGSIYVNGDTRVGIVDYAAGVITLEAGFSGLTFNALVTENTPVSNAVFSLNATTPILETFYLQVLSATDTLVSASSDANGVITGAGVSGTLDNGLVTLSFTQPVKLNTLTYDITEQVRNLPPADIYGLNPLRVPNNGIVDGFRVWGTVAIQHSQYQAIPTPAAAQVHNIRQGARFVDITDATGLSLWTPTNDNFTVDTASGTVTLNSDFSGFTAPFILSDTIGELGLVTALSDNLITLAGNLTQQYPINSTVASVQILGDLQARVGSVRDMTAWANNWTQDGTPATGNLNTVDYPIEVNNRTAVNEDWVLIFNSTTSFRCVGRRLGQIATGDVLNDFSPINPQTNAPYFVIRAAAFGGGWNIGEAIRFNTYAAAKPIMPIRITQAGHSQITTDKAVLAFRGNES
ncbi:conserved hypothetical protein [Shewanella denitrificans OS217]|uniref:Uncharacterized protein n=1 Tax=Shewanella denitrificans (strain OS217 / ATCC BAA-1090 / DSM 15013) TaxID=318161 RepID=Q12J59_SHEDO|nr:hypothetical protein [Shewanella denitrificans]ABE56517.1 conserved hypothetical protein [Shewanella denitrificans OS217]